MAAADITAIEAVNKNVEELIQEEGWRAVTGVLEDPVTGVATPTKANVLISFCYIFLVKSSLSTVFN